jgi:hypothetical protein
MKKMTHKTLTKKIQEGYAEVLSWSQSETYADVMFFKSNGKRHREWVEVTGQPNK